MVTSDHSRSSAVPPSWADPATTVRRAPLWRRALPLAMWFGCLLAAVALLLALGGGRLGAPPLTDPGAWGAWAAGRDPLEVAMVVLRLLALGLAWYLTGVTSISVVARLLRAARLVRLADALSFGPVKVLVQQAVGIGLAASVLATAVPAAGSPTGAAGGARSTVDAAVMVPVSPAEVPSEAPVDQAPPRPTASAMTLAQEGGASAGTELRVPVPAPWSATVAPHAPDASPASGPTAPASPTPTAREQASPAPGAATATVAPGTATAGATAPAGTPVTTGPAGPREVRVEPGDHFWALAEREVAAHLGRSPTDIEVVAHWQAVVEANADRLEVPGNPDFLLPGQLVVLPPVGEVPS